MRTALTVLFLTLAINAYADDGSEPPPTLPTPDPTPMPTPTMAPRLYDLDCDIAGQPFVAHGVENAMARDGGYVRFRDPNDRTKWITVTGGACIVKQVQ